jgi:hypothetical protein
MLGALRSRSGTTDKRHNTADAALAVNPVGTGILMEMHWLLKNGNTTVSPNGSCPMKRLSRKSCAFSQILL